MGPFSFPFSTRCPLLSGALQGIGKISVLNTGKKQGQQPFKDPLRNSRSNKVPPAYGKVCCMDGHSTGHQKKLICKMARQRLTFCRSRCGCHIGKAKGPQFPECFLQVLGTAERPAAGFLRSQRQSAASGRNRAGPKCIWFPTRKATRFTRAPFSPDGGECFPPWLFPPCRVHGHWACHRGECP